MRGKLNEDLTPLSTQGVVSEIIAELLQWAEREKPRARTFEKAGEENATNRRPAEMIGDFDASFTLCRLKRKAQTHSPGFEIEPNWVKAEAGPF